MKVQHVLYDGKWIADVRNDSFSEGQNTIIYLPGIDKVDSTGTEAGLIKIETSIALSGKSGTKVDPLSLYNSTDHFKNNVLTTAPKSQYQYNEIQTISKYADEIHKPVTKGLIVVSLGGYGLAKQVHADPELPKQFDAIVWAAMGPGTLSETAKNLANAKVPNWFIVTEGDDGSGTHDEVTYNLHKAILAAGGISFLTIFRSGYFADPHVIQGVLVNSWDAFFTKAGFSTNTALPAQTKPNMSVYQWLMSNKRGTPVVPPDGVYKRVTSIQQPAPIPEPIPIPPTTDKTILRVNITGAGSPGLINVVLQYIDSNGVKSSDPARLATEVDTVQVSGKTRYTILNKGTLVMPTFEI